MDDRIQAFGPLIRNHFDPAVPDLAEVPDQVGTPISTTNYSYIDHIKFYMVAFAPLYTVQL